MTSSGRIFSINTSRVKGVPKTPVSEGTLIVGHGLEGDAHAGAALREVSLLSIEGIRTQKECERIKSKTIALKEGDFAENITTEDVDLSRLKIGSTIKIGNEVILEVTKIGKECHKYCQIYYNIGSCIMPKQGIFAGVIKGGIIKKGDTIAVHND
ncbi:MAG: molybdenum cofactor sulfurase [Spirochaetes bacterium RBG_16_49_21]|nr:MAG: molybdenum cofactor sulfurase [Spirochaetes bacterium RBG_16_49_21]